MRQRWVSESNPQYAKALEKLDKITLNLLQAARETFVQIYYPGKKGLMKADFIMSFNNNNFNGEDQVKGVLTQKQKFTTDVTGDTFKNKCQDRLFTQKEMRWVDVRERAATEPLWQWHIPRALDDLKDEMLRKNVWRENGGYVDKGPFPKEKTEVMEQERFRNDDTGEVTLKLIPKYGDNVLYEIGAIATEASLEIDDCNDFKTSELVLSFLCVDSTQEHETGDAIEWKNRIELKYRVYDKGNDKVVELRAIPKVPIHYTTDGSSPKENGGLYNGEFVVPNSSNLVLAVVEGTTEYKTIQIDRKKKESLNIDKDKPIHLKKRSSTSDTAESYQLLDDLKKQSARLMGVNIQFFKNDNKSWVELNLDPQTEVEIDKLEASMENIRNNFMNVGSVNISLSFESICFPTGQDFLDWVAKNKFKLNDFKKDEIEQ